VVAVTGLSLSDADRLALAAAGVAEGPDGSLRSASGAIVSPGVAAALISRGDTLGKAQSLPATHPVNPGDYRRPYLSAGHAANSPANGRRGVVPEPPEGGGRSASLCTTPPDSGDAGAARDDGGVEKVQPPGFRVAEPEAFTRGPLTAGHETPSPGDRGDNSPVLPGTASGHEVYGHAAEAFNANVAAARAQHVMPSQACVAEPATSRWSPSPDLGARNVPVPASPGHLTGTVPGER
jgi:hypothetical protein